MASFQETKKIADTIEGWLTPREALFLYTTAKECKGKGVILEIGSWQGKSTTYLANGGAEGGGVKVVAVDPHIGSIEHGLVLEGKSSFDKFKDNMQRANLTGLVTPIVKTSEDAVVDWKGPIEFLWIDGDHSYAAAKLDFDKWSPYVVDGGTIAFHDSTQEEVPKVICESFGKAGFSSVGLVDSIAYATKKAGKKKSIKDHLILSIVKNYNSLRKFTPFKIFKNGIKKVLAKV